MSRVGSRYFFSFAFLVIATGLAGTAIAQGDKPAAADDSKSGATVTGSQAQPTDEIDPLKRLPNEKQKKQQKKSLKIELSKTYKKWLNEDVVWIIT
jgi:hypothetical protein